MNTRQVGEVLDAAVQMLINERCRRVNLGALVKQAQQFLRNAALSKGVTLGLCGEHEVLGFARRWIMANGGRVDIQSPPGAQAGLRIYYPLAAA